MMQTPSPRKIELLAPAKNADIAIEAIRHGADAVYIGASQFGARAAAGNKLEEIARAVDFAHTFNARIYATVNTILYDTELTAAEHLIRGLYRIGVDAIIVQDMGILRLDIPPIQLHASTQCDTRTVDKARFLEAAGFSQIVLARELTEAEITKICDNVTVPVECFIHGALCVSYSGRCHASCALKGRSANRGECAQICRLAYDMTDGNGNRILHNSHLLSLRDFNQSDRIEELLKAGVSSFKIEGRLKDVEYVKNVTAYYHLLLDKICREHPEKYTRKSSGHVELLFKPSLEKSFNRGFTHYFFDDAFPSGKMASFETPKSRGEQIGKVIATTPKYITVKSTQPIVNGDGLAFIDRNNQLVGFRANKIEGSKVYPLQHISIAPGTAIYRNYDKAFSDMLNRTSTERRLGVKFRLSAHPKGIALQATDELGNSATVCMEMEHSDANSPQSEAKRRTLAKLGNTPYRLDSFEEDGTESLFIAASALTAMRRNAVKALQTTAKINYHFEYRRTEMKNASYPSDKLIFADNVSNRLASRFFKEHGVHEIQQAMETEKSELPRDTILMTTRYCLRRELGCCLKSKNAKKIGNNLTLTSGAIRMSVEFDCKNCQMILRKV